ncbi:hypothetical protein EG240_13920 [Paenimyroides tangerinum]|uniref:Uncharacterized protein n=1 Tax=Paenimyroides tangerinum TaxID=2488728 RepID=A0A3P3VZL4_9FLAO|nr:hypothetical protein [Paenimyroides tangerinum]RRJ88160.1 hypothetical protein EG240_13920 [Paenimyroides tangerinum]
MEKITSFKILKICLPLLITNLVILFVFYYFFGDSINFTEDFTFIIVLIILMIIPLVPQLFLVLNHFRKNRNVGLTIYQDYLLLKSNGEQIIISENTINSWELVGTSSKLKNSSIKFSLLDDLFYLKIGLKESNKEIILSSLLYSKIDNVFQQLFPNPRKEDRVKFFPIIK